MRNALAVVTEANALDLRFYAEAARAARRFAEAQGVPYADGGAERRDRRETG